eukprot:m.214040 g.214040  ORF g.214040 m.214040 type:complete len:887 (-) comp15092_c0_seq1:173-2833(-)
MWARAFNCHLVALLPIVLSMCLATTADTSDQCGVFDTVCIKHNNASAKYTIVSSGMTIGMYSLTISSFSDDECQTPAMTVQANASYTTLGLNAEQATLWQVTYNAVKVTPETEDAAAQLNTQCPCADNPNPWQANNARLLKRCVHELCPDTTWLGGMLPSPSTTGILIGSPAFGFIKPSADGLVVSLLDANYNIGTSLPGDEVLTALNRTSSCDPANVDTDHICGSWSKQCSPNFELDGSAAVTSSFQYTGSLVNIFEAGQFAYEQTYYSSSDCFMKTLQVIKEGTIEAKAISQAIQGGTVCQLNAASSYVTPYTDAMVQHLKAVCPCGDPSQWQPATTRTITSCPIGQCSLSIWNNTVVGQPEFAAFLRTNRSDDSELRFTHSTSTVKSATTTPLISTDTAYTLSDGTCAYPGDYRLDICGTWELSCAPMGDDAPNDVWEQYSFIGNAGDPTEGEGLGIVKRERIIFEPFYGCNRNYSAIKISDTGFWSDAGNDVTKVQGARQILINIPSTKVLVADQKTVDSLNNPNLGCPCGGTWQINVPRVLTTCPPNTCNNPSWLGAGEVGSPGFGIIRETGQSMRLSKFLPTVLGYKEPLGVDSYPLARIASCPAPNISTDYTAHWFRPCSAGPEDFDFKVDMFFSGTKYNFSESLFNPGVGCDTVPVLEIVHSGGVKLTRNPGSSTLGHRVRMTPSEFEITPQDQGVVDLLNQKCPCTTGKKTPWTVGKTASFNAPCPVNTCSLDILRQPIGAAGYGLILREYDYLRMTDMLADQTNGYNQGFGADDYFFVRVGAYAPGISARDAVGTVLILIVFFSVVAYLIFAVAIQYKKTGAVGMPHPEFWRNIWALVLEGVHFSCVSCFGFRQTATSRFTVLESSDEEAGSYGTL